MHRWSAANNPHVATQWAEEIAKLREEHPDIDGTPWFKQMYLGQWAIDEHALVYRPGPSAYDVSALPEFDAVGERVDWVYVLAVDLGWADATAFVLGAFSYKMRCLYLIDAHKESGLDFTDVSERIKQYRERFAIPKIIVDGANKQGVEEMRRRHRLPLECAEKQGKADYIAMMNGDFDLGGVKVLPPARVPLDGEWSKLVWDAERRAAGQMVEASKCENHLSDAALYLWRYARNYLAREPKPLRPKTQAELAEMFEKEHDAMAERTQLDPFEQLEEEYGL